MGLVKWLEEIFFTGRIVKNYGMVCRYRPCRSGFVWVNLLMTERKAGRRIIIKQSSSVNIARSVQYIEFDAEGAQKLLELLGLAVRDLRSV
jgi:hypothetical protein